MVYGVTNSTDVARLVMHKPWFFIFLYIDFLHGAELYRRGWPEMGQVIIFNPSTSKVKYEVNGKPITPARPAASKDGYQPVPVAASRSQYPGDPPGSFGYGDNRFRATFLDVLPPETPVHEYSVYIPRSVSLVDDLILYVFRARLFLMTMRGYPLPKAGLFIEEIILHSKDSDFEEK